MVHQKAVEECLVPVLQRGEPYVFLQVVALAAQVLELEGDLLLDGCDPPGKQPPQGVKGALFLVECGVLVDWSAVEQLATSCGHGFTRQVDPTGAA